MSSLALTTVHEGIASTLAAALGTSWNVSAWPVDNPHAPQIQLVPGDQWLDPWRAMAGALAEVRITLQCIVATNGGLDDGMAKLADFLSVHPSGHGSYSSTLWGVWHANKSAMQSAAGVGDLHIAERPISVGPMQSEGGRFLVASVPLRIVGSVA